MVAVAIEPSRVGFHPAPRCCGVRAGPCDGSRPSLQATAMCYDLQGQPSVPVSRLSTNVLHWLTELFGAAEMSAGFSTRGLFIRPPYRRRPITVHAYARREHTPPPTVIGWKLSRRVVGSGESPEAITGRLAAISEKTQARRPAAYCKP